MPRLNLLLLALVTVTVGCRGTQVRSPLTPPAPPVMSYERPHDTFVPSRDFRPVEIAPTPRRSARPTPAPAPPTPAPLPKNVPGEYMPPAPSEPVTIDPLPEVPTLDAPALGVSHERDTRQAPRLLPGLTSLMRRIGRGTPVAYETVAPHAAVTLGKPVFDRD
ncbi:MAG: hypothetical protein AAF532_06730 [Planctomycetota bacterium]